VQGDKSILNRFLVFADIGGTRCALFDRTDGSIWFEDEEQLSRTDMSLFEFIDALLQAEHQV
jgi:hypothetical protein